MRPGRSERIEGLASLGTRSPYPGLVEASRRASSFVLVVARPDGPVIIVLVGGVAMGVPTSRLAAAKAFLVIFSAYRA